LGHVHANNIIHRDLKLKNIMMASTELDNVDFKQKCITPEEYLQKCTLKLIDFGMSKQFSE
jgi:serine/threonine protein kinase